MVPPGEKVRTTRIRMSKTKKNVKKISKHQNIESVHKSVFLVDHNYKNQNVSSRCDTGLMHEVQLTRAGGESKTKGKGRLES
jgi:hypothetical protein